MVVLVDPKTGVTDKQLRDLRGKNLSIPEIAERLRVKQIDVTRMVRLFKLGRIDMANMDDARRERSMEVCNVRYADLAAPIKHRENYTRLERAMKILIGRVTERNGSYYLDGRAVRVWELLKAAGV